MISSGCHWPALSGDAILRDRHTSQAIPVYAICFTPFTTTLVNTSDITALYSMFRFSLSQVCRVRYELCTTQPYCLGEI